ncbi:MAG: dihydroorotase [Clostridiales bacterium]|nr:dihydroorotase [Clostridiales bacterium]
MDYILKNGTVYVDGKLVKTDLAIVAGKVSFSIPTSLCHFSVIDCSNKFIFPGFIDAHVHLREPGFSYKETIKSGTMAGASAGYSALFSMPNLKPVPDSVENLKVQTDIIEKDAVISVYPYASITIGQKGEMLSDIDTLSKYVLAFSDDGVGVQSEDMMKQAMLLAKKNDKFIVAHCEDNSLLNGGYIHDGEYAKLHGHKGICSASEYKQIERDLSLAKETGVKYHVCHVSAKESVSAIRDAKRNGVNVTCETGPHYLLFDDSMLKEDGAFKMNPPIRAKEDRLALIEGIKDGTVDMIATDHAPHSLEEKSRGLKSVNGIVGLETAFAVLYTKLVKTGEITLEHLIKLMSENPSNRFNLGIKIENERLANLTIFDLDNEYEINSENFKSKGKSTPFNGWKVFGKCLVNFNNGKIVYSDSEFYGKN